MLFGQIPRNRLNKTELVLPKDSPGNAAILGNGKSDKPKIFLGCAKWGRTEWLGKIYPEDAKEKDFLSYYALHYNSIELNATNYKIYEPAKIKEWIRNVNNPKFIFCPKAHRGMSFFKHSPTRKEITKNFIKSIRTFGKELGPVFITHDEKVKFDAIAEKELFEYLGTLPNDLTYFIEERWPGFYADKNLQKRYYDKLKELKIGTVITDTAGRRDVLHMNLTIPKAFVRFVGNSLHPTDYPRIDQWALRFKKWIGEGIEEIYFFMHMHDEGKSPELTQYAVKQFNKKCKLNIPEIKFVDQA